MAVSTNPPAMPVTLAEAQAFVRAETGEEEALIVGLIRSATEICEQFIGQWLMRRRFETRVSGSGQWQRLDVLPVCAIDEIRAVSADGSDRLLDPGDHVLDIDAHGTGWVRIAVRGDANHFRVAGEAGLASDPGDVPEALRQGILRLVAHMFANRDADGGAPPAAVTALWRPYRRMRL